MKLAAGGAQATFERLKPIVGMNFEKCEES
jgi:hypothetical protein